MQAELKRRKKYDPVQMMQTDPVQMMQTDRLSSVHNGFLSPQQTCPIQDKLTSIISKRISKLHVRQKMRIIKNVMHNLYGRHNPINYQSEFNFQERWQNHNKQTTFEQKYSLLKTDSYLYITLHIVLYTLYGFTAWFFSVYRLFMIDDGFYTMIVLVLVAKISATVVKQVFLFQTFAQNCDAKSAFTIKDYLKYHWLSILSVFYLAIISLEQYFVGSSKNRYFFFMDLFFTWRSYYRFKQLYSAIKFKSLSSNYRNQIQILQLFGGCILLVHTFGLVLFLVSMTNPARNWTYNIHDFGANWESRYVHSVYFACTTALTVGFGDILPKTLFEIITIMCVQILGIINIGYIVNEIGRVLSKINQSEQVLYNNISQTQKIIKNYSLPQYLAGKMRSYVINNQMANNKLRVEEEDNLINNLKDEMRQKIIRHNQLKIVKTSVFFICNWTKKFQINMANKLIRAIYSPQETLAQVEGKEKIFILTKGKLQLQACFSTNSSHLKKTLQTIEHNPSKEVQFNVYGYSSCISGLKINIRAIAKDYSICYYATKQDIIRIVSESQNDFEYFHQIKVRIQQSRFKEVWQAPDIANTREHYLPNPYYIMKKNRLVLEKKNNRKYYKRKLNRMKCYIQKILETSQNDIDSDREQSPKYLAQSSIGAGIQPVFKDKLLTEKQRMQKYDTIKKNQNALGLIANRRHRNRYPKIKFMETDQLQKVQTENVLNAFQANRHFKAYLPKFNFVNVIKKYNKKNGIKQGESKSTLKISDTKLADMLDEELLQKILSVKMLGHQTTTQSL